MEQQPSTRILVAHGVNLDLLGRREPDVYGVFTLADVTAALTADAPRLAALLGLGRVSLTFFQTNVESELLARVAEGWDGILINPAAWTHTSLALADRLVAVGCPYVEVHISNTAAREPFRHVSYTAKGASGVVSGLGLGSYRAGLFGLLQVLATKAAAPSDP